MNKITDAQLLENAYNNGLMGISKDVYELFKELIERRELR